MRQTLNLFPVMFLGFALAAQADGPALLGDVFPAKGAGSPVFTAETDCKVTGTRRVLAETFKDRAGRIVASHDAIYESGRLLATHYDQKQSHESGSMEVKDGKALYTSTQNGKTKRSVQSDPGNLVPCCAVPDLITTNWDDLAKGKTLGMNVPVLLRHDAYGYKLTRVKTWSEQGRRLAEFKVEASSAVVRAFVDPYYYVFDDQSRSLVQIRGLAIAKVGPPGNMKDLDARVVYRQVPDRSSPAR